MRTINYSFDNPYAGRDEEDHGSFEVPDNATDDEIEEMVQDLFFERYNYGWSEADQNKGSGNG